MFFSLPSVSVVNGREESFNERSTEYEIQKKTGVFILCDRIYDKYVMGFSGRGFFFQTCRDTKCARRFFLFELFMICGVGKFFIIQVLRAPAIKVSGWKS